MRSVDRDVGNLDVAFVGLGSIGRAALELLLWRGAHPRSLTLCDVHGSTPRLGELERQLRRSSGYAGPVLCVEANGASGHAPGPVYAAGLIVGATSRPRVLNVDRLRPGTIVVDDSFPHCFDAGAAIARMRGAADVLLAGGGLLDCGATERTIYVPQITTGIRERIAQRLPWHTVASCQLESLLQAADPALPPVHGLVDLAAAERYWAAAGAAGVRAGPLHLQSFKPDEHLLMQLRGR